MLQRVRDEDDVEVLLEVGERRRGEADLRELLGGTGDRRRGEIHSGDGGVREEGVEERRCLAGAAAQLEASCARARPSRSGWARAGPHRRDARNSGLLGPPWASQSVAKRCSQYSLELTPAGLGPISPPRTAGAERGWAKGRLPSSGNRDRRLHESYRSGDGAGRLRKLRLIVRRSSLPCRVLAVVMAPVVLRLRREPEVFSVTVCATGPHRACSTLRWSCLDLRRMSIST